MTRAKRKTAPDQFDLFLPYLSDLPLRDQREMMERPFFSLSKTKRIKPIDYTSPDGKLWVNVSPNAKYGMATIWDADILIYCASQMADMKRRGVNDIPRTLHVMPYDILRSIGRPTTGRAYELLAQALDRLVATTIKTNIRAESRREATFTWLDGWTQIVDEKTERSMGMTLELSNWFYEGVMMEGGVLSIDPAYFDITGGREPRSAQARRRGRGGGFRHRHAHAVREIRRRGAVSAFQVRNAQAGGEERPARVRLVSGAGQGRGPPCPHAQDRREGWRQDITPPRRPRRRFPGETIACGRKARVTASRSA